MKQVDFYEAPYLKLSYDVVLRNINDMLTSIFMISFKLGDGSEISNCYQ